MSRIDPSVTNGTVTVDVKLEGEMPKGVRPDLSVDGTITLESLSNVLYVGRPAFGQEKIPWVCSGLIQIARGQPGFRLNLDGARLIPVEIVRGLKEGDRMILSDMSRYDAVDRIRLSN